MRCLEWNRACTSVCRRVCAWEEMCSRRTKSWGGGCVRVCVRVWVCACACVCVCVFPRRANPWASLHGRFGESLKRFPAFWSLPGLEEDLASGAPGAGPRKYFLMNMRVSPKALPALPRLVLRWSCFSRRSHLEHPVYLRNKQKLEEPRTRQRNIGFTKPSYNIPAIHSQFRVAFAHSIGPNSA